MKYKAYILVLLILVLATLYALISGDEEKYHKTYCPDIKSRSYKGLASFDMLIKDNAKEYAGSQYVGSKYPELYSKLFLGCSLKNSSKENLNTFYESGTGHLLSISGLHIGAIALIIFLMVNSLCHIFLRGNRKYKIPYFYISIPLGFLFSLSYVLYIGVEIPRLRALIMLGLVMVGLFFSVFRRRLLVLAFTASVILIFIPGSVYSYSFYYSFASVLAILLLPNKKNIHLCTMIFAFLIPLNLHSNGSFNPMHIIANFVIVPIFSLFYFPLMLFFNLFTAYDWVLLLMDRITDLLLKLVNFFSILSQYTEYKTFTINTVEAGFLYILLIGFFIFFKYHKKINKKSAFIIYLTALTLSLIIGVYVNEYYGLQTIIRAFDLKKPFSSKGSGDIILINIAEKNIVLDTGHGLFDTSSTIKKLKKLKIDKIDYLVISHRDMDHAGGLEKFKEAFLVKNIVSSPLEYKNLFYETKEKTQKSRPDEKKGEAYLLACEQSSIKINESVVLEFINPDCNVDNGEPNRHALSFVLRLPSSNIVFSSDVPFKYLSKKIEQESSKNFILQMSHHCSKQDNPKSSFKKIKPLAAFCTRDKSLLKRGMLGSKNFNFPIFATGKCGDIKIKPENRGFWIFSEKCSKKYLQFKKI